MGTPSRYGMKRYGMGRYSRDPFTYYAGVSILAANGSGAPVRLRPFAGLAALVVGGSGILVRSFIDYAGASTILIGGTGNMAALKLKTLAGVTSVSVNGNGTTAVMVPLEGVSDISVTVGYTDVFWEPFWTKLPADPLDWRKFHG